MLDIQKPLEGKISFHGGLEYPLFNILAIRAGFNGYNRAGHGVTFGFGIAKPKKGVSVDYALAPYGDLGSSHQFSASWRW